MKPIVVGNWKMNKTVDEGVSFVNEVKNRILDKDSAEVIFCPPFTSLFSIANLLDNSPFYLGAQNVHSEIKGAYTGEVSIQMLKSLSVDYVILGHSERRTIFGESSEFVRDKIDTVLNQGIKPILCIGEALEERRSGQTEKVLQNQLEQSLSGISRINSDNFLLAYEPIWAIGTGNTATEVQVAEAHAKIRSMVGNMLGKNGQNIPILYGGSVSVDNVESLIDTNGVDGFLIGGASLDIESFCKIIELVTDNIKRG